MTKDFYKRDKAYERKRDKKKNLIKFIPVTASAEAAQIPPRPARDFIPEWYKVIPQFLTDKPDYMTAAPGLNTTVKRCMPYYDAMTGGYIQSTWADIYVTIDYDKDGNHIVTTNSPLRIPGTEMIRTRQYPKGVPIQKMPDGYHPIEFVWMENWVADTPKDVSIMFQHPANRYDLPFVTLSGIVDADYGYVSGQGTIPFYIKKEYTEFLIPEGTPMYQLVPMVRRNWKYELEKYDLYEVMKKSSILRKYFTNGYTRYLWHKKRYD